MKLLGIRVDNLSKQEILEKVTSFLSEPKFHQIATVNPEFILEARKNQGFRNILNSCDLNVADGIGIRFAFLRYRKNLKYRVAGADLMLRILEMANQKQLGVFLVANKDGLSTWEEARDAILKIYPNLSVTGTDLDKNTECCSLIPDSCVLFCNFGAPHQEIFINKVKCDNIRLAMGVGGGFDYFTGKVRRAPRFWRFLGLEWLWRLILQPKRWKRIWQAVIIFPIKVIFNKND